MCAVNVGILDHTDPLYEILADRAYPDIRDPVFRVDRLSAHRLVYRYSEEKTKRAVVGKFFRLNEANEAKLARIKGEYSNLVRLRQLGLSAHPYSVVTPFCHDERIGLAVAEEFVKGKELDYYLRRAATGADGGHLAEALSRLASFLCTVHERTASRRLVSLEDTESYFRKVVSKLKRQGVIDSGRARAYLRLAEKWLGKAFMMTEQVTVHGDATPTNFLFPDNGDVVAIDLERMKPSDRIYDVGMICGELKHAFLWRTGNRYTSEPFIEHFLRRYAGSFPSPAGAFRGVTQRLPFYMAMTELRIARNGWLDWDYRKRLAWEAWECLSWGLRT
jgi:aminoglycoside phosphotransferase (APT) family kinase protein